MVYVLKRPKRGSQRNWLCNEVVRFDERLNAFDTGPEAGRERTNVTNERTTIQRAKNRSILYGARPFWAPSRGKPVRFQPSLREIY